MFEARTERCFKKLQLIEKIMTLILLFFIGYLYKSENQVNMDHILKG